MKQTPMQKAASAGLSLIIWSPKVKNPNKKKKKRKKGDPCNNFEEKPKMSAKTEHIFLLYKKVGSKLKPKAGIQVSVYDSYDVTGQVGLGYDDFGRKVAHVVETKQLWASDGMGPAVHDCMLYYFAYYFGNDFWSIADRTSISDSAANLRDFYYNNRSYDVESIRLDNMRRPMTRTVEDDVRTHSLKGGFSIPQKVGYKDVAIKFTQDGFIDSSIDYETLCLRGLAILEKYPKLDSQNGWNTLLSLDLDMFELWYNYMIVYEQFMKRQLRDEPSKPDMTGIYIDLSMFK